MPEQEQEPDSKKIDSVDLALLTRLRDKGVVVVAPDDSINLTKFILGSSGLLAVSLLVLQKAVEDGGTSSFVGAAATTIAYIVYLNMKSKQVGGRDTPSGTNVGQTVVTEPLTPVDLKQPDEKLILNELIVNELISLMENLVINITDINTGTDAKRITSFNNLVEAFLQTNPELNKFLNTVGKKLLPELKKTSEDFKGGYKPKKSRSKRRTKKSRRNKKSRRSRRY